MEFKREVLERIDKGLEIANIYASAYSYMVSRMYPVDDPTHPANAGYGTHVQKEGIDMSRRDFGLPSRKV